MVKPPSIDIAADGWLTVTYRHELVNATPSQSDGLVGAEGLLWTPSDDAVAEGFEPSKALALHAFEVWDCVLTELRTRSDPSDRTQLEPW